MTSLGSVRSRSQTISTGNVERHAKFVYLPGPRTASGTPSAWMRDSVYEAACLAIRALKKAGFVEQQPGAASRFQVQVLEPVVTHEVTVGKVQRWLELVSSNPNEEAKRTRLRELMTATK